MSTHEADISKLSNEMSSEHKQPGTPTAECRPRLRHVFCPDSWQPLLAAMNLMYPDFRVRDKLIVKFWEDIDKKIDEIIGGNY